LQEAAVQTELARWGNSLAVRIPKETLKQADLQEGDRLMLVSAKPGELVLTARRKRRTLKELVSAITPENLHSEADWGQPVGKELW
jgi:antitoxin MazE